MVGNGYEVFYSYNPPKMIASWVNAEVIVVRPDRLVHTNMKKINMETLKANIQT